MSTIARGLQVSNSTRVRSLLWPREHGAWGILLVPLVTGACVGLIYGQSAGWVALFVVTVVAHFCLRTPLAVWLGTTPLRPRADEEQQAVLLSIITFATIGDVALIALLVAGHAYGLLALGAVAIATFFAQPLLREMGRHTRLIAQWVGCIGLTSAAPGAYYVATGHFDGRAYVLWAVNWLFVANQVHFVNLRLRATRAADRAVKLAWGRKFLAGELVTAVTLALAWRSGSLPGLAALAFGPVLLRGVIWFWREPAPLDVHRLGFSELLHAMLFGVLVTWSFATGPLQV